MRTAVVLLCLATSALAQQLPPLDPAIQLGVCQAQRARFLSDSEQAQAYAAQFMAEIASLKAARDEAYATVADLRKQIDDLKDAEARVPKDHE